jgi:predicted glycosyltransferase involved in capsule biosynthesis
MAPKFSAIIPWKSNNNAPDRERIWSYNKKRWEEKMPDVELLIGDNTDELYNRSAAVNSAAEKATGDYLIIVDNDVYFGTKLIDVLSGIVDQHPWVIPYSRAICLTEQYVIDMEEDFGEHILPSADYLKMNDIVTPDVRLKFPGAFMNVVPRAKFLEMGGMDERFRGWGFEDRSMVSTLNAMYGQYYMLDYTIFHCGHKQADREHVFSDENQMLYMQYVEAEQKGKNEMQKIIDAKNKHYMNKHGKALGQQNNKGSGTGASSKK